MTKRHINRAIKHLGVEVHGARGDGCFYFIALATGNPLNGESVYVAYLNQYTLEQWVSAAEAAVEEDAGRAFKEIDSPSEPPNDGPSPIRLSGKSFNDLF